MKIKTFIKKAIKAFIPYGIFMLYKRYKKAEIVKSKFYGNEEASYCPICGKTSYFEIAGLLPRMKAKCTCCGSLERHRLLWLFLNNETNFFVHNGKLLHIAAEPCFENRFRKIFKENYLTADLNKPGAMIKMDITNIQYPENSFDIIICNHVLEHVKDDRLAMRELRRVLRNDGFAILLVPLNDIKETYEDFSIDTEIGRLKAFGQKGHVRRYGKDYIKRLEESGFKVRKTKAEDFLSNEVINKDALKENNLCDGGFIETEIYYCTK